MIACYNSNMGYTNNKKRFGLSVAVEDHMTVLKVLAQNDNEVISRFWKSDAGDANNKRTMLFHTLAMLDSERLHAWIATTPVSWWIRQKEDPSAPSATTTMSLCDRYDTIAGGMLQYLYLDNQSQ